MTRPVRFRFSDTPTFDGQTDDTTWNGFLNVTVAPAELQRIKTYFAELVAAGREDPDVVSDDYWPPVGPDGRVDLSGGYATSEVTEAGWPCQCGHYRHDDGYCSGTLGSMLDTDAVRPEDDRSEPCVCAVYVPVDADWARGVGFTR